MILLRNARNRVIIRCMHNWDYPKNHYLKQDEVWYLERLLTHGITDEKIDRAMLERNFDVIKIPENTRIFFELLLWNKPF